MNNVELFIEEAIEGLLVSQIEHYKAARGILGDQATLVGRSEPEPWYFIYLDQVDRLVGGSGVNPETGGSDERIDS